MATTVSEGTIRVHRSIGGTGAAFRVAFVPYGEGDDAKPAGERSFQQLQEVRVFLKVLGIGADYIKDVLRQLTARRSGMWRRHEAADAHQSGNAGHRGSSFQDFWLRLRDCQLFSGH